ncbi:hypothetical protein [Lacinutrix sp. MedPE-SW]|uniref:hypothetical protein n=1 Tax=Lacinutrix sp. MedPE-SW TaxID=1860087 RepID=UPI000913709B|nr:hypothetical protein [Lacinutrix sp. MedPE-SW]OIQ24108.1 MAG: hypothetical protein BM549_02030 [Lacinutrix sp. MedPE-SW]
MPKEKLNQWAELLMAITPKGHKWKDFWHLCNVLTGYLCSDSFKSSRRWLVYVMHISNWIDLKETPYKTLTNQDLANLFDSNVNIKISQEEIYSLFNTTRNTFKKNFKNYLELPKEAKMGKILLAYITKWQDSRHYLVEPISKQQLADLSGLYHKKIATMFVEIPQAQDYFETVELPYEKIKQFPPRLVEIFFEEIGEPERIDELISIIKLNED